MSPNAGGGGGGGMAGSQPTITAVHRSPNKLWRSNSIFNLWGWVLGQEGTKGSKGTQRPDFQANTRPRIFFKKPMSPKIQEGGCKENPGIVSLRQFLVNDV
jgi:hypothetical protein